MGVVNFRASDELVAGWRVAAAALGVSLSAWLVEAAVEKCGRGFVGGRVFPDLLSADELVAADAVDRSVGGRKVVVPDVPVDVPERAVDKRSGEVLGRAVPSPAGFRSGAVRVQATAPKGRVAPLPVGSVAPPGWDLSQPVARREPVSLVPEGTVVQKQGSRTSDLCEHRVSRGSYCALCARD